jgi:hypothetical protein
LGVEKTEEEECGVLVDRDRLHEGVISRDNEQGMHEQCRGVINGIY